MKRKGADWLPVLVSGWRPVHCPPYRVDDRDDSKQLVSLPTRLYDHSRWDETRLNIHGGSLSNLSNETDENKVGINSNYFVFTFLPRHFSWRDQDDDQTNTMPVPHWISFFDFSSL